MNLTTAEKALLAPDAPPAEAMAMRILVDTAQMMGASRLVPITSAHIDGCVYFGDGGVLFAEKLRDLGGRVAVPSSLNVGALDIVRPELVLADDHARTMSRRLMDAYVDLGCIQSWTCAPYQAGYRPKLGEQIAWAESNAIVFANSVLGARTNRYGDFFDICAALTGRAPFVGLHRDEDRIAKILIDLSALSPALLNDDSFYPVLGAWLGRTVGSTVAAIKGVPSDVDEDRLKALGAAAASTGAVGLFHVIGVTPEADTEDEAFAGEPPEEIIAPTPAMMRTARNNLSTTTSEKIDCVALGSPHFSLDECRMLAALADGLTFEKPVYVCTRHAVLQIMEASGVRKKLEDAGVIFVVGTCVVVTPILKQASGVLMTNSGKFAHYGPSTVNHEVVYGSLGDCLRSAVTGKVTRGRTPVVMTLNAEVLVDGSAEGDVLKLDAPICFWGGVDPATGKITDPKHPDHGAIISGKVLAIPRIVGSSSSSQLLLELLYMKKEPAAIILGEADAILGIASLVGREMTFGAIPILQMPFQDLANGGHATVEPGGRIHLRAPA